MQTSKLGLQAQPQQVGQGLWWAPLSIAPGEEGGTYTPGGPSTRGGRRNLYPWWAQHQGRKEEPIPLVGPAPGEEGGTLWTQHQGRKLYHSQDTDSKVLKRSCQHCREKEDSSGPSTRGVPAILQLLLSHGALIDWQNEDRCET